ncbi:MAG: hypothetical protein LBO04_04970 [Spirochaetaceae bacterium]|jgi:hypothetical protein|nr:hypothetical protein [Spirochaetaceae bacterium]
MKPKYLFVLAVLGMFIIVGAPVSAQQTQKIRRNVLSYRFYDGEELAGGIEYTELEWSRETQSWLPPESLEYLDKDAYDDVRANPGHYHTLTLTIHYKDGTKGYMRLKGGWGTLGDSVQWSWMNSQAVGVVEGEGVKWNNSIALVRINPEDTTAMAYNPATKEYETTYIRADPEKGKNKLFFENYDLDDILVIELDGSFFPE